MSAGAWLVLAVLLAVSWGLCGIIAAEPEHGRGAALLAFYGWALSMLWAVLLVGVM